MRWPPSKGVIIRLCIYLPIIGYLVWTTFFKRAEEAPAPNAAPLPTRTFTTEDGKKFEVIQVTPEQAEQMMGRPVPSPAEAEAQAESSPPSAAPARPEDAASPAPQK